MDREFWEPNLAACLGGSLTFDGDEYRLIQFDFEQDIVYLELEGSYIAEGYRLMETLSHKDLNLSPPDSGDSLLYIPPTLTPREPQQVKKITVIEQCKTAALSVAEFQAGKALNIGLIKAIKPHTPMIVRGYLDSPLAIPLIAIALTVIADQLEPDSVIAAKVQKASKVMLSAAFMEGADKLLDVEKLIDNLFSKLPPEAKSLLAANTAE